MEPGRTQACKAIIKKGCEKFKEQFKGTPNTDPMTMHA